MFKRFNNSATKIVEQKRRGEMLHSIRYGNLISMVALFAAITLSLGGCGGANNPAGANNVDPITDPNGPDTVVIDNQTAFSQTVYPIVTKNCNVCHTEQGPATDFANSDVASAYQTTINRKLVDLTSPADSVMVTKLSVSMHHCVGPCADDAAEMQAAIEKWVNLVGDQGMPQPAPTPAPDNTGDSGIFSKTVYPLLTEYCSSCHGGNGPGTPAIAHSDYEVAYNAVVDNQKVNLKNPTKSRLYQRLANEFHFCWSVCADDAKEMLAAIQDWATMAANSGTTPPEPAIVSAATTIAEGGKIERVKSNLIAFYDFKERTGDIAHDTSGVDPAIDLTLTGIDWLPEQGIEIKGKKVNSVETGKAIGTPQASKKLYDMIAGGNEPVNEYTVEAWIESSTDVTGTDPLRIVAYDSNSSNNNFAMAQLQSKYIFRNRSLNTNNNGNPYLTNNDAKFDVDKNLQHVVMTFDQKDGRKMYINGEFTKDVDSSGSGSLSNWDNTYRFVLGNVSSNEDRLWRGKILLTAVYNRALSDKDVIQNYKAGLDSRTILKFDVSTWLNTPGSTIQMEVTDFDKFSYMLTNPTFVGPNPNNFRIKGISIAVNDVIPLAGQSFRNIDTTVNSTPQGLSRLGAVIAKDEGPDIDKFSLVFEVLGANENITVEKIPTPVTSNNPVEPSPDAGLRTFDQINNTMSVLTGVPTTNTNVQSVYNGLKQQLPSSPDARTFLSAQQVGISKLALEYCDAMVSNTALRTAFFANNQSFQFGSSVSVAFSTGDSIKKDLIVTSISSELVNNMYGVNLATQPDADMATKEVGSLINALITDGKATTQSIVKLACNATLASAAMLLQ